MTAPTRQREAIDPRIRQRRIEVQRTQGRRRLRVLLVLLAIVAVVAAAGAATRSPLLDVDHVTVIGAHHVTPRDIVRVTGLERQPQMIDLDSRALARTVERLPWIATATVKRQWPSTVAVTVVERSPVASAPDAAGGYAVLDITGRVLLVQPAPGDLLPVVGGPAAGAPGTRVAAAVRDGAAVAAAMPPALRPLIGAVNLTPTDIDLGLVHGGVARLGDRSNLAAKLDAVLTVLQHADVSGLSVLDVRVPAAPVLTRR